MSSFLGEVICAMSELERAVTGEIFSASEAWETMQVLADELAATSNIRVNSLNPGAVNTSMRRAAYPGEPPDTNPAPSELTQAWIYLMSDASREIHGQALSAQA
mgnify:CR=1 FL=1